MTSFTTIEETAMLMNDTPAYDFACHYYNTKYGRLKGVLLGMNQGTKRLEDTAKKQWEASFNRFTGNEGTSWSMTWFRLRTFSGMIANSSDKPYKLEADERDALQKAFTELLVAYPTLQGTLHIIQIDGSDTVLLAGHIVKQ